MHANNQEALGLVDLLKIYKADYDWVKIARYFANSALLTRSFSTRIKVCIKAEFFKGT